MSYSVSANAGRSGRLLDGSGEDVYCDAGVRVRCSISPTSAVGGSNATVYVSCGCCTWTAVSNASWITVTGGSSGNGNGTVSYSVAANTGSQRSGTITIGGKTFTVYQASGCTDQCNLQRQYCYGQAAGCADYCVQMVLQQNPGCVYNPGACMPLIQACAAQCTQQMLQSCDAQYQQCVASCN